MSIASVPDFFLTRLGDELVLHRGQAAQPTPDVPKKRILVVGGGVTGFTVSYTRTESHSPYSQQFQSAWALLDAGYDVTIIAERWTDPTNRITSQIAGALWEWPPAVCGKHTDVRNQ